MCRSPLQVSAYSHYTILPHTDIEMDRGHTSCTLTRTHCIYRAPSQIPQQCPKLKLRANTVGMLPYTSVRTRHTQDRTHAQRIIGERGLVPPADGPRRSVWVRCVSRLSATSAISAVHTAQSLRTPLRQYVWSRIHSGRTRTSCRVVTHR